MQFLKQGNKPINTWKLVFKTTYSTSFYCLISIKLENDLNYYKMCTYLAISYMCFNDRQFGMCITCHLHIQDSWREGWYMGDQYWAKKFVDNSFHSIFWDKVTLMAYAFLKWLLQSQDPLLLNNRKDTFDSETIPWISDKIICHQS